jgi:hypothetical protein
MTCSSCVINTNTVLLSDSKLSAKISSVSNGASSRISSTSALRENVSVYRNFSARLSSVCSIAPKENVDFSLKKDLSQSAVGNISSYTSALLAINQKLFGSGSLKTKKPDKFAGYKPSFRASEKLYPIQDISFKSKPSNQNITVYKIENNIIRSTAIYSSIDDGVFTQDYVDNGKVGSIISDDSQSFGFTYRVFASGDIEYKFAVTTPLSVAKLSYLAVRASAPFSSYINKKPEQYRLYDIKFEDPNGKLIIQYEDILIRGEGESQFTTYISKPLINNLLLPTWDANYPSMDISGPYTLRTSFAYDCSSSPFNVNFDSGYEQTCIINSNVLNPNPFIGLNISALEIGNSGGVGIQKDNYLNFFTQVRSKSERTKKIVLPNQLLLTDFNNKIYPEASSVWRTPDGIYTNTTDLQSNALLQKVQSTNVDYGDYINLIYSTPSIDSGRLVLRFGTNRDRMNTYTDGAFNFGGNKSFNDAILSEYQYEDYFDVDYVELKVIAKKNANSPDYPIDVVGYSDDKLLYGTSPIGGFLQNGGTLGFNENNVPNVSGYNTFNFGMSNSSLSDQSEYFSNDISPLGDHYIINNSVVVNSTSFKEYIVPLEIYSDPRKLGNTRYSLSPYFENLYVDICPIPSGASIAHVSLILYYKPANALSMHTLGSPSDKNATRKNITLLPSLSGTISNPNLSGGSIVGFTNPSNLNTNYSRRWRGNTGEIIIGGDFKKMEFDFSFNHKQANSPFLNTYIDFNNKVTDSNIYSDDGALVAQLSNGNVSSHLLSNVGWRYSSEQLFGSVSTPYKSIKWANNIDDTFDKALRLSGSSRYLKVFSTPSNNSFCIFLRFTPDYATSFQTKNLLEVVSPSNLASPKLVLSYNSGSDLRLATNSAIINATSFFNQKFPLSLLITYNDDGTNRLKMYINNSSDVYISTQVNNLFAGDEIITVGNSMPSTFLDLPIFLHEFGISKDSCNIVESNPDRSKNQISVSEFFDSYNVPASYIDDDISQWKLGAFKVCQFSPDFDFFTKRIGKDFITFNLSHNGSGYYQTTNLTLPNNINLSGVAYHTQIENDFLRFDLSDIPQVDQDRFFAISPRISKNLPKGYNFYDQALCVDTILEHDTYNNIMWSNGKVGPKFIVSLYAKTQDSLERPSKQFGLVNRSIHHLEPSGCVRKITSKFTFDDILDTSEPWASFDVESYSKEFKEKYFLNDINQMFLQYDLVYPSGEQFSSKIKIHSSNIRSDNAIYLSATKDDTMPLYVSGSPYQFAFLNLFAPENGTSINGGYFNLYANSNPPVQIHESGLKLFVDSSGYFVNPEICNLYTIANGSLDTSQQTFSSMFGSSPINGLNLFVSGKFIREDVMPLHAIGSGYYADNSLNCMTFGPVGSEFINEQLPMRVRGISQSFNAYPSSVMSLHTFNDQQIINNSSSSFNLFLSAFNATIFDTSGNLPLITLNYPISDSLASKSATITWDSNNVGQGITSVDNVYAYVDADDNIRGVNLACYGDCNT